MSTRIKSLLATLTISINVLGAPRQTGDVEHNDTTVTWLESIEVIGQKSTDVIKSSVPVSRLDADKMLRSGVSDITDAIRRMAGVTIRDYGGIGGLKTVSVRGLGAQHTGVVYDGASLSDIQTGQIDLSRYSLNNISALSMTIGDADNIYQPARSASNAAGITINTISESNLSEPYSELHARLNAGSFYTLNPYLRYSLGNGKNIAFSLLGDYLYSLNNYPFTIYNGSATERARRENSLINKFNCEASILWQPSAGHTIRAKGYYYQNYRQLPGPVIYYAESSKERLNERNSFGQVIYRGRLSDKFSLSAIAKFNWSSTRYKDTNGIYPGGLLDDYYIQNEEYLSAVLLYRVLKGLQLSLSSDYYHNSLTDNSNLNAHPRRDTFLQCLAAQYQIWRIKLTVRGLWTTVNDSDDKNSRNTNTRLSPSLSFSLQPLSDSDFFVRASYKNIFRMPSFNELYFQHYGTINLDPEIADQINIGVSYSKTGTRWFDNIGVTLDAYHNHISNKIVAMPFSMFLWTMTNLGKVRSIGIDATLSTDIRITEMHHIALEANYSYQRAASRTNRDYSDWNKQLPYTPLNSGSWSVTWLNPWVNFVAHGSGCSARYSTTTNISQTRMPGYMEIGFSVYRDFKYRKVTWETRIDLTNAFNRQYEIVRRYPVPGHAVSISLGVRV